MTCTELHAPRGRRYPTGTAGRTRTMPTPELQGSVRGDTAVGPGPTGTPCRELAAEATRRHMHISAPPAAGPSADRWLRAGRRSCVTWSGHTDVGDSRRSLLMIPNVLAHLDSESGVRENHTVEPVAPSIKADGEETRQPSYTM
jgi:hypothetical protein